MARVFGTLQRGAFGALAALALLAATPVMAQWKWRDASGQIHLSDLPPPREVNDRDVLQRPNDSVRKRAAELSSAQAASAAASAASATAVERPRVDPELEARRKRAEIEQANQKKTQDDKLAAERGENCKRAQEQLRTLESGMRVARVNEKGEREFIDDATRATQVQRARNVVQTDCR